MKRTVLFLIFGLIAVVIGLGIAYSAEQVKTIRVGQELRMVVIFSDREGTHFQYFTEPGSGQGPKILGEEIFKNGEKIFDSYTEND